MKIVMQLFLGIVFIAVFSFPGFSKIDEEQVRKAESFLAQLENVGEQDLQYEFKHHIGVFEASTSLEQQAKELEIILSYALHMDDAKQIFHYAELQDEVGKALNDPTIIAMAEANFALSRGSSGQFKSAIKSLTIIDNKAIETGDLKLQAHVTMLRGLMATYIGRSFEAIEYLKAIERQIIDKKQYDMQRMIIYWTIAFNAVSNDDLDNTLLYYGLSVDLARENGWAIDRQSMVYNIAALLAGQKAHSVAEKYFREYGRISLEVDRQPDVFFMHYGLAGLYLDQKKFNDVHNEILKSRAFDNIPIDFKPFLFEADVLSLAHLGRIEEAKAAQKQHKQFFIENPEFQNTEWELTVIQVDAEILHAEARDTEAYEKLYDYHVKQTALMKEEYFSDAFGMRQNLETAYAIEEAENKLAQSEIANQNMFIGAAILVLAILTLFFAAQRKSAIALKISKAKADDANQTKSKFLANVSHELRTPLNAIIGFSDIMKNEGTGQMKTGQYKEYSALVNDAGRHLLSIINDILDLNKIEAGMMELNEDAIDISWLLDDIDHLLQQTAIKAEIELQFNCEENLPELYGDERQIKQILINLVNNSIKFSESNTEIHTSAHLREGGGITIKIQDQGQGMTESELEKAMQPFSQIKDNLNSDQEGTGLGLPLAKAMTELHNGIIKITSVKGEGTLVELDFPTERVITAKS